MSEYTEDEKAVLADPVTKAAVESSQANIDPQPRPERVAVSKNVDIPVLEGWVGLTEAGELTGVTRQQSYKRARTGFYKTLHKIGNSTITVVSLAEIEEINSRNRAAEESAE